MAAIETQAPDVREDALWGMKHIAQFLGCSPDYLAKLIALTDIPVAKIDGRRCFALKSVLRVWILEKGQASGE